MRDPEGRLAQRGPVAESYDPPADPSRSWLRARLTDGGETSDPALVEIRRANFAKVARLRPIEELLRDDPDASAAEADDSVPDADEWEAGRDPKNPQWTGIAA